MKKLAFVFPGYGCSHAGMGKGICEYSENVKEIYEKASAVLGFDAAEISSKGRAAEVTDEEVENEINTVKTADAETVAAKKYLTLIFFTKKIKSTCIMAYV